MYSKFSALTRWPVHNKTQLLGIQLVLGWAGGKRRRVSVQDGAISRKRFERAFSDLTLEVEKADQRMQMQAERRERMHVIAEVLGQSTARLYFGLDHVTVRSLSDEEVIKVVQALRRIGI